MNHRFWISLVGGLFLPATLFAQEPEMTCRKQANGEEVCGYDCKTGGNGTVACASTAKGTCAVGSDGIVSCVDPGDPTVATNDPTQCLTQDDGKEVCGFNCLKGTDGNVACSETAATTCYIGWDGAAHCDANQINKTKPEVAEATATEVKTDVSADTNANAGVKDVKDAPTTSEKASYTAAFRIRSEFAALDNLDFRELNNDTFFDRTYSDDRFNAATTFAAGRLEAQVIDELRVDIDGGLLVTWGQSPTIGSSSGAGLLLRQVSGTWAPLWDEDGFGVRATVGVIPFSIGGADRDYFFNDTVTGLTTDVTFGKAGMLRLIPLDVNAFGYEVPSYASIFGGEREGGFTSSNFAGDLSTLRFGGVYENTKILDGLEVRAFGFFADIGGGIGDHTGSDRSFGGAHANFSDNDYNWIAGARAGYTLDTDMFDLGVFGEFARSGGLDRKAIQVGIRDINANGNAFGAGLLPTVELGALDLRAKLRFFRSDGAQYTGGEGLVFNYGFVGMRGSRVGGLAMRHGAGWRPVSWVSNRGVSHNPHDKTRSGGTQFFNFGIGTTVMERVSLDLGAWIYQDTGSTNLTSGDIDAIGDELPFGYTQGDLLAQERLGNSLGIELDSKLTVHAIKEMLDVYVAYGVFLPSDFYAIEIPITSKGDSLGSDNPQNFWAIAGGAEFKF